MKILILEGLHGNNKGKKCQWRLKRTDLKTGDTVVLNCHDWKVIKIISEKKRNVFPKGAVFSEYSNLELPYKMPEYLKGLLNGNRLILVGNKRFGKNSFYCAFKNKFKKEVKKVRPYFEMKVVKVNKADYPKCKHLEVLFKDGIFKCVNCGHRLKIKRYDKNTRWGWTEFKKKPKGNWVNGENLDKIKFPCFCSYTDGEGSLRKKGFLSASNGYYYIADITSQKKEQNDVGVYSNCYDLKTFIRENNIHIIKGKIIIYEEK